MYQVLLGGGQKAAGVTQSSTKSGHFQARFFHMIFEEELATVKGHFGPINTIAFSPDGLRYGVPIERMLLLTSSSIYQLY